MKIIAQSARIPKPVVNLGVAGISDNDIIRLIFGFKTKYLRQQKGYSYQELSTKTGISVSYLNDIEKGKRYPKPDKINALADAFSVDYSYMVATNATKRLQPIIDLLTSRFFKLFPLESFGLKPEKLTELFSNTPDKLTSFLSTILKLARSYQINEEIFYKEALRSYQDMHDNYFPEIEAAVEKFKAEYEIVGTKPYTKTFLSKKLKELGVKLNTKGLANEEKLGNLRSYFSPETNTLFLQKNLSTAQQNFLLAREIGFQYLKLDPRPRATPILEVGSFDELLNNYKASHFGAALLMDEDDLVMDIQLISQQKQWTHTLFTKVLKKYNVTAETFLQRLTNILPHHFGIKDLFFMRMTGDKKLRNFKMTKDLHLSGLHNPYNIELNESFCHRWVSITAIKQMRLKAGKEKKSDQLFVDAQISKYWNTDKEYLCITAAKPAFSDDERGVSITLGMLVNDKLKSVFYFLNDPELKVREVHTTCERCGIYDCEARVSPPSIIEAEEKREETKELLLSLK